MKSPLLIAKFANMNGNLGQKKTAGLTPFDGRGVVVLVSSAEDKNLLKLPEIHQSGVTVPSSKSLTLSSLSSAASLRRNQSFQGIDSVSQTMAEPEDKPRKLSRSLVDIREESFDSDCSRCASPMSPKHTLQNGCNNCAARTAPKFPKSSQQQAQLKPVLNPSRVVFVQVSPMTHGRGLHPESSGRRRLLSSKTSCQETSASPQPLPDRSSGVGQTLSPSSSPRLQIHKLGANLMTADGPDRPVVPHGGIHKSQSNRDFTAHERENCFPVFQCTGKLFSREHRQAARVNNDNSGGTMTRTTTVGGLTTMPSPPATVPLRVRGMRHSSSSPVVNKIAVLPQLAPAKSASQPEMAPSSSFSSSSPTKKRERVRGMWKRLGQRMGLRTSLDCDENGLPLSQDGLAWTQGPGGLLRPVYERWITRRNALAQPEKMCMPQELRERIQRDVENRKASLTRRVSNLLTIKLGLDKEEDLLA